MEYSDKEHKNISEMNKIFMLTCVKKNWMALIKINDKTPTGSINK